MHVFIRECEQMCKSKCKSYLIVDGDGAQAVQEQQQGGVHVMKQVPGLMALGPQRKADLSGPADKRTYSHFKII